MFDNIRYEADLNCTWFFTPEHMLDVCDDIIDRTICWDSGLDVAYGYMFDELERKMF